MSEVTTLGSITQLALLNYRGAVARYARASERSASGYRINSAADDPSGAVAIATLQKQMSGITAAIGTCTEAGHLLDTAYSALGTMDTTLQEMRSKALEATGTLTDEERAQYQADIEAAIKSLDTLVSGTEYNDKVLLDGSYTDQVVQLGTNAGDATTISINDMSIAELGSGVSSGGLGDIDLSTPASAETAVDILDAAIDTVGLERARLGGINSHVIDGSIAVLTTTQGALASSLNSMRNVSPAESTAELLTSEIQLNAATSMVAHSGVMAWNVQAILMGTPSTSSSGLSLLSLLA